jgi:ABC-type sugar transport system substrate-binding protein
MKSGGAMKGSRSAVVALVVAALMPASPAAAAAPERKPARLNPIIFVHGFVGSGAQFESQ